MNSSQYMELLVRIGELEESAMRLGLWAGFDTGQYEKANEQLTQARRKVYDVMDAIAFQE